MGARRGRELGAAVADAALRSGLGRGRARALRRPPATTREQIDARIEQLLENPRQPHTAYDEATDQWTTTYGAGAGLIVYEVVHDRQRLIILRLVQLARP